MIGPFQPIRLSVGSTLAIVAVGYGLSFLAVGYGLSFLYNSIYDSGAEAGRQEQRLADQKKIDLLQLPADAYWTDLKATQSDAEQVYAFLEDRNLPDYLAEKVAACATEKFQHPVRVTFSPSSELTTFCKNVLQDANGDAVELLPKFAGSLHARYDDKDFADLGINFQDGVTFFSLSQGELSQQQAKGIITLRACAYDAIEQLDPLPSDDADQPADPMPEEPAQADRPMQPTAPQP